jgi:hypothetical protein
MILFLAALAGASENSLMQGREHNRVRDRDKIASGRVAYQGEGWEFRQQLESLSKDTGLGTIVENV